MFALLVPHRRQLLVPHTRIYPMHFAELELITFHKILSLSELASNLLGLGKELYRFRNNRHKNKIQDRLRRHITEVEQFLPIVFADNHYFQLDTVHVSLSSPEQENWAANCCFAVTQIPAKTTHLTIK